jgi:pimeloyl-ACP methyl ester carboxylesterase
MSEHVAARGLTFDVRVDGPADGTPALLLHGFPEHSGMWAAVSPALHDAGLRTIAPDQRGYSPGARPSDVDAYRMSECVADAVSILDSRAEARPTHVVGHDWGAVVGWRLASEYPERVRSFTAISVPHPAALRGALISDPDQRERSAYLELFADVPKAMDVLLDDDAARLRALFDGSRLTADVVESYVTPMRDPDALAAALRWYAAMRLERTQTGVARVPTTFVWGTDDLAIGRTAARACGEHVASDYAFVPLEGVSHWVPEQAPRLVVDAVLRRVARTS